jgi:hypothetical protein
MLVAGLPIAHHAVGDAMAEGPSRRRQAELPPAAPSADPNLSGSAALTDPLRQARLAPPFPGTGCASAMRSRPRDPDRSADGYVRRSGILG